MVAVSVHMDVRRLNRTLNRVQKRQIPFAVSLAINKTLPIARQIVHDEWHRQLGKDGAKLKRGFPKQVLRWKRSTKVNLVGVLRAVAGEEVIRLQTKGGVKTAKGSALKIPASDAPKRSRKRPYRAGNYLFFPRKGTDKYAAKLQKSVRVPKAFRLEPALAKIRRAFRVELEKAIRRALATAR